MLYLSIFVGLIVVAVIVSGILAILRNNKSPQNRWFFFLTVTLGFWITANFIDSNFISQRWTREFLKADFASVLFIAWALLEFTNVLLVKGTQNSRLLRRKHLFRYVTLGVNLWIIIITISGLLISATVSGGILAVNYSPLFVPYVLILLAYFGYALIELLLKRAAASGDDRRAVNTIFIGLLFAFVANVLTNVLFPTIFKQRDLVQGLNIIGYGGLLIFAISIFVAITRQRLFDIRAVVARSFAYIFSLAVLAAAYGFVVFGIAKVLFDLQFSIGVQIFFSAATGIMGLSFQRFRGKFDRLTNKIFFRDAYDAQELFGQLNKVLVSSLDVKYLMTQSVSVIEDAIKSDYVMIALNDTETRQRYFSSKKVAFDINDMTKIRALASQERHKVFITDYLDAAKQTELHGLLKRNDVAALVRLTQSIRSGEEGFGYLALGIKKSGNPYTDQDARVLDTVANELIIAIQNALHYEEIQQFNLVLQARVDDATRKLRRTNEKLKSLDETKDDFISMASHQLRTPLTSVKGYLSMVLEGDAGDINDTQRKMLGQAFTSSQRMVYLIADLLNVSRLKTGKFLIDATPTNLAEMVSEEIDQLVETAASKDIELTYKKPKEFPDLMLDDTKTRQVIMNFVDNAIYYTPSGGHIRVELHDNPTSVELRVVDDGIGVPKAEQHHLFTKFYRAGNARKARPDGTGLGLYMAKKVILAQGGSIIFESQENKGSTFGFLFAKATGHSLKKLPVVTEKTRPQ